MALQPRFRRVAALDRRFVDREGALEAFAQELGRVGDGPRVLNVTGVGGIGKSRLLRELRDRASASCRTAGLDLQVPSLRQHEDALAVLRMELGRQGVGFDRFDIGYAVLWQRLHPHLKVSRSDLPFAQESEILSQVLGEAAGVPVVGTAVGLVRLARRAASRAKERRVIRLDDTLARLDELPNAEVVDAVTYLFAEDLRTAADRPYVIFIDAYEALVPTSARAGRTASADVWLRDLIAQLDTGLVVVASREPLGWQSYDPEWGRVIRRCPVDGLPMAARLELLAEAGIPEAVGLAEASQGLPFYLHLAMDTQTGEGPGPVVSSQEILQRFLHHVAPGEIRLLELLSLARIFDYQVFHRLAEAFELPKDRMTWESVTSYSFVYPAGATGLRLHQLMAQALRDRLPSQVRCDVHRTLHSVWVDRTAAVGAAAWREAAYHGIHTGALDAEDVLDYADRAIRQGGRQAGDGILADLNELPATGALAEAARCLEAENAIIIGDAAKAAALTGPDDLTDVRSAPSARLAIATAHARRIAGDTEDAARIYARIWEDHAGRARLDAGLWMADIRMWQGGFRDAFRLIEQVLEACPDDEAESKGDVVRLAHLGHRFHLDFAASIRELERAREFYWQAASVIGLANIATNQVELTAWTDPAQAVRAASHAIEAQQELAALHELGKTYTALAVAQLRLDEPDAAAESFDTACRYLERAGYRSGRARAELFSSFLHIRSGRTEEATRSIKWAIRELVAAQVYPTLMVAGDILLGRIGVRDLEVADTARRARAQLDPLDSLAAFEARTATLIDTLLGEG